MADDLIEKLWFCANLHPQCGYPENGKLFGAAADRITALQAQNRKLVEALKQRDGGAHDQDCRIFQSWRQTGAVFCNCGHDEAVAAIAEAEKGEG